MMNIEVNTTTATLIPPRESLTPGSVNAVQLKFTFSDEWNGLTKTCVFSNEIETVPAEMQNDSTAVPTDVLDEVYRWISVGVSGEDADGTVIIPTIWCRIGQCLPGVSGRFVTIDMLQAYWSKQEIDLHTDGDGSKFLGDDGVYHSVAQGGGDVTHEELEQALALKADKAALDALTANVDDKADKSEIITVTTGDGTKYLADDGTYKTITGGGDVTQQDLADAIAPLATKDELNSAVAGFATQADINDAVRPLATTAAMNAALALKADKTELTSYAKQYDVNQALATKADKTETQNALVQKADKSEIITVTTGDGTKFLADDGTYKTIDADSGKTFIAEYNVTTAQEIIAFADTAKEPFAPILVKRGVDYYTVTTVSKQATNKVILVTFASLSGNYYTFTYTITDGAWASSSYGFQKVLESGVNIKTVGGETLLGSGDIPIPDVSDMLTKTEAGTTYATKTELADYETTEHAAATYATKAELPDTSDMLTKTEAESTYATIEAHNTLALRVVATESEISAMKSENYVPSATAEVTYAKKDEIITVTTGTGTLFLADDGTYKPAAGDPPDLSAYLTKTEAGTTYETQTHAAETYATKAEIPDVSGFETTAHASATYATKTELTDGLATKVDSADIADMLTKTEAGMTYATQTALTEGLAGKVDTATLADYETTAHASATYATKAEIPDVTGFETTAHAEATYATKTELADKADASAVDSALALKADKTELASYETTEHASATYATKTELTEGLAGKVDTADIADMLTKTEAEGTYADKVSVLTLENTVDAQNTRINNLDTNKADKTQIITVMSGSGTLFLADDGTYKPAAGDPPDLSAYLTKTEAGTTYATQTALTEGLADKADASALADYETTAHASATYATKAELPDVSDMLTKTEAGTTYATKTELAEKADASALADYETTAHASATYATKAELPDVSDMLTKTEAGTTYATQTALTEGLAGKVDTATLADYETTAHASATYETKEDASKIKSVTAAGFAVTPDASGNVNIGGTDVSRAATSGSWGSEITYTIAQTLPTGASSDIKGSTFTVVKRTENSGATPRVIMTVDGVQLATSADVPDVSHFATTDYVQNTFESTQHAAATYLKITDAAATYQTIADASQIKSITAGGEAVAPDANGNVAIAAPQVSYSDATNGFQGWASKVNTDGTSVAFSHTYTKNGSEKTNLEFDIALVPAPGSSVLPTLVSKVRAVTWDEFTTATTDTLSKSNPGSDYFNSMRYGTTLLKPQSGGVTLPGVICNVTAKTVGDTTSLTSSTEWVTQTNITRTILQSISFDKNTSDTTSGDGRNVTLSLDDSYTAVSQSVRLVSYKEMQEYIASLDGTNMAF